MERPTIRLVPIETIRGADYNPRRADESRLALVRLSLQKLGWLLPVFANAEGLILSGHQRTKMAKTLGYTKVPVMLYTPKMGKNQTVDDATRGANLLFNRCTNDMGKLDNSTQLKKKIFEVLDFETVATFRDVEVSSPEAFRCIRQTKVSVSELLAKMDAVPNDLVKTAKYAAEVNCVVPLVVTKGGKVINGRGRVAYANQRKEEYLWATVIEDSEADVANTLLNFLSMDFDVEASYGDILRHNSFRRAEGVRSNLGQGFTFRLPAKIRSYFDHKKNAALWKSTYGTTVLDFGAGQRQESYMLNDIGVRCLPFEPFCLESGSQNIDYDMSRAVVRQFFKGVASGMRFDSIFLSSVLQSVPFINDRLHVLSLIHSLCTRDTAFYACAKSRESSQYVNAFSGKYKDTAATGAEFCLDHEEGVIISKLGSLPKIQKFYTEQEFVEMMKPFWADAEVTVSGGYIYAVCRNPLPVNKERLRNAIEFEFDLPYPKGKRMGLVEEAKQAWTDRGVILT